MREIRRALVVATDTNLRSTLLDFLHAKFRAEISTATDVGRALDELGHSPDLLVLQLPLLGGEAVQVAEAAAFQHPAPIQIAIADAVSPEDAFRIGRVGVAALLARPLSLTALSDALAAALRTPPDLGPVLKASVGQRPLRDVQHEVRRVMVTEAMARSGGSRGGAGRLLKVSRQAVQQALRVIGEAAEPSTEQQRLAG